MNTRRTRYLIPAAALVLALAASGGHALGSPGDPAARGGRGGGAIRGALASLDLTAEQKEKVKALFQAEKPALQARRDEAQAARLALRMAAQAPTPDPTEVGKAFLRVQAARKAGMDQLKQLRTKLDPILTPAQQAKLDGYFAAVRHGRQRAAGRGPVS